LEEPDFQPGAMVEEKCQPIEVKEADCKLERVGIEKGKDGRSAPGREGGQ